MKIHIFDKSPTPITNSIKHYYVFYHYWQLTYQFAYHDFYRLINELLGVKNDQLD